MRPAAIRHTAAGMGILVANGIIRMKSYVAAIFKLDGAYLSLFSTVSLC